MKLIDYLIVGQGIAGTMLAHYLQKEDCTMMVIDNHFKASSTKVAAGIINPITGRRVVKSWKIDELLPFAKDCYQEIEAKLAISVFRNRNILRAIKNVKDENLWLSKTAYYDLENYITEEQELGNYKDQLKEVYSFGEITQSAQVDVGVLIEAYRSYFLANNLLVSDTFDFEKMKITDSGVKYGEFLAQKVIFCEGYAGRSNPYFDFVPFELAKGEMLIVYIPDSNFEKILKHGVFIVPTKQKDHYWVGATYEWEFEDDSATEEAKQDLVNRLKRVLKLPFEVKEHFAAVRPSVKDRRPMIGLHPDLPRLGFFNGLGTKGTSLAPFWAKHLVDVLLKRIPIDPEVKLERCLIK